MDFSGENFEQHYQVFEELGSGQFAVVRRCRHKSTGGDYAAKFIRKRRFQGSRRGVRRADVEREVAILQEVGEHDNIIKLFELFETSNEMILVLELVSGGELFEHVCHRESLHEAEASAFVRQMLLGVKHLHDAHIVHLDLKPENVMLLRRGSTQIKLIDFGLSRRIGPNDEVRDMIGTPEFVAPEIVNYEALSAATDIWALGVVTYILLSGASPFLGADRDETFANITSVNFDFDEYYFRHTSELAKNFIRALFRKDPEQRLTVDQCLNHPWIKPLEVNHKLQRGTSEVVNLVSLKAFNIRKRWKRAYFAVLCCLRIINRKYKKRRSARPPKSGRSDSNNNKSDRSVTTDSGDLVLTALLCAAENGDVGGLEQLSALITLHASMENALGETPIHVAAGAGHMDMVTYLIIKGADINQLDKHGDTPLYYAARQGHVDVVNLLRHEGAKLNAQNKSRDTALHVATRYGNYHAAAYLVSAGADPSLRDEHGETPIHVAAWHGFPHLIGVLCALNPDVNSRNKEEETALHCASARGHVECVQTLVSSGSDLDLRDKHGNTALQLSIRRHHVDIALLLLHAGSKLDSNNNEGDTALHLAAKEGLLTVVQALCALGCNVDVINSNDWTPLHMGAKEGHIEIIRVLCLAGCNINAQTADGQTAEQVAAAGGFTQISELLGKLKTDQQKDNLVDQLCPGEQPLRCVKLKLFGDSGTGKTLLLSSLQTSFLGGLFRRQSQALSLSKSLSLAPEEEPDSNVVNIMANGSAPPQARQLETPLNENGVYTRGIDVQHVNFNSVGEFSTWEFSGYVPYHSTYDHFVGNTDCIHLITFRLIDPQEVQYAQVLYWLNFLKARIMPGEIGDAGTSSKPAHVLLVGTHADQLNPPLSKNADGEFTSHEADAMLKTLGVRFGPDFRLHDHLLLIDANQTSSAGMKALKAYLSHAKTETVAHLTKMNGFLEATITYLTTLRKQQASFPVVSWPAFIEMVRSNVNPLAGEVHCRQLIQQLQLMGEVVYLKGDVQDFDYVVLSPHWLCHDLLGALLSFEHLQQCRVTGTYSSDDLAMTLFPSVPDVIDLLQILDALNLCTHFETDGDSEYEFPAFNFLDPPTGVWEREPSTSWVYGGLRLRSPRGQDHMMGSMMVRLQVQLRRSMLEFQDPMEADLSQWRCASKLCSGSMEAYISLFKVDEAFDIRVRAPADSRVSAFYFLEDLVNIAEQTVAEIAPGLSLERHFLSPRDLAAHVSSPVAYPPECVIQMQLQHKTTIRDPQSDTGDGESFLEVVCFGSKEVAMNLTLGIDLPVSELPLNTRRELAALLDPPDSLGRDWSILGATLGLTETLPEVESTGGQLSKTDQLLLEWSLQNPNASIGVLCDKLQELGRRDALDLMFKSAPLYLITTGDMDEDEDFPVDSYARRRVLAGACTPDPHATAQHDSGVAVASSASSQAAHA